MAGLAVSAIGFPLLSRTDWRSTASSAFTCSRYPTELYAQNGIMRPSGTRNSTQHFITLSFDSRAAVDEFHRRAIDAGALMEHDAEDSGDMYQRGFNDPEGQQWGLFWAAPASTPPAP